MISSFKIDPRIYNSWVAFAHDFCKGCIYENGASLGSDYVKKGKECFTCRDNVLDRQYYRERKPVIVLQDETGKNIAKSIEEK